MPVQISGRRKTSSSSVVTSPAFIIALSDCRDAPVKCSASRAETLPVEHNSSSSDACIGAFLRFVCARANASPASTARSIISHILSFTRRAPTVSNQHPAGRIALTASYTVQNSRSCIQRASFSCARVSMGSLSRHDSTGLSFSHSLLSASPSTIPSLRRLPRENGTVTRIPGTTLSTMLAGIR